MDGHVKMQRIQQKNRVQLQAFREILAPEVLHSAVPRLATVAEARVEKRAIHETMTQLGKYCNANGFDPTHQFQHVAQIDVAVWSAIVEAFGKFDEETGELGHDGLLYVKDPATGNVKMSKPFFYSLLNWLEASGYPCDLRGKIKLT